VKTLTRYIGREVFAGIMLIFGGLVMLFAFFDLIHELGRPSARRTTTVTSAFLFVTMQLPSRMYELFPGRRADRHAVRAGAVRRQLGIYGDARLRRLADAGDLGSVSRRHSARRRHLPRRAEYVGRKPSGIAQQVKGHAMGDTRRIMARQFSSGFWFKQDYTFRQHPQRARPT